MSDRIRVAVYGGDDRVARLDWPGYLDVTHYEYKSPRQQQRLQDSLASGKVRHLILLTNYMGHSAEETLRASANRVNVIRWPRSPMQLMREITTLIPPPPKPNPLYTPPQALKAAATTPVEQVVIEPPPLPTPPPLVDEPPVNGNVSVAEAIRNLLKKEGMTQKSFAQLLGVAQATVSSWSRGESHPTGERLAKLLELVPELVSTVPPQPGKKETITVQVTRHVEDDELIAAVREWQDARDAVDAAKERLRLAGERLRQVKR